MSRQGNIKRGCKQLGGPQIKFGPQTNDMEQPYDPANELYEQERMNRNNYYSDPRNELSMSGIGKDMPSVLPYNPNTQYSDYKASEPQPSAYQQTPNNNPRLSSIINAAGVAVRGISEGVDRRRNDQYYQQNQSNPLMGILPYNDGRSDEIKYGSNQFAMGGIYDTPKSEYGHTSMNRRGNLLTHDVRSRMIHPNIVNVGGRAVSGSLKQYQRGGSIFGKPQMPDYLGQDALVSPKFFDAKQTAQKEKAQLRQGRVPTAYEQQERIKKNELYQQTHPYTKIDDNGNLSAKDYERGFDGQPVSPQAKRWDRGLDMAATSLEAAGYITGAGELASMAKPLIGKTFPKTISKVQNIIDDVTYPFNKPKSPELIPDKYLRKEVGKVLDPSGSFNMGVYNLKRFPNTVLKMERADLVAKKMGSANYENFDFVEGMKNLPDDINIAKIKRQYNGANKRNQLAENVRGLLMNKVPGKPLRHYSPIELRKIPDEAIADLYNNIKTVRNNNLTFDFMGDNVVYDKASKKFGIYDINPEYKSIDGFHNKDFWENDVFAGINNKIDPKESALNIKSAINAKINQEHQSSIYRMLRDHEDGFSLRSSETKYNLLNGSERKLLDKVNKTLGPLNHYKKGGVSEMGYRDDSPFRGRKSININTPNGLIDMSATGIPLIANGRYLAPYSGMHQFDTTKVTETPAMQKGGTYVTSNLNDPRIKAYDDSLHLYTDGEENIKRNRDYFSKYAETQNANRGLWDKVKGNIMKVTENNIPMPKDWNTGAIKPIGAKKLIASGLDKDRELYYSNAIYQKPIQPVIYQPEITPLKKQSIKKALIVKPEFRPEKQRYNPELLKTQGIQNKLSVEESSMNLSQSEGDYRVQYTDPSNMKETHKMFQNVKQGDEFREALISQGLKGPVEGTWNKKFQKGGMAPYITNNSNDPRIKSYNDSLSLYNTVTKQLNKNKNINPSWLNNNTKIISNKEAFDKIKNSTERDYIETVNDRNKILISPFNKNAEDYIYGENLRGYKNLKNSKDLNNKSLEDYRQYYSNKNNNYIKEIQNSKIQPINFRESTGVYDSYGGNGISETKIRDGVLYPVYKNPTQKVIYQPEQYDFHGMKVDKKGFEDLKWASTTNSNDPKIVDRVTAIFDKFKVKYVKEDIPNGFKKTYDFDDVKDFIKNIKPNSTKEVVRKKNIYNPELLKSNSIQSNIPVQFNNVLPQEELNYQVDYTDPTTNQRTSKRFRNEKEGSEFQALQEGNREGYYRKFQMGGANVKDFSEGWLNSPKHMEYLQNSVGANAQAIKEQRIGNLKRSNVSFVNGKEMQNTKGAYTRGRTDVNGNIEINNKLKGIAIYNTTNHELGHTMYNGTTPEADLTAMGANYEEAHAKINSVRALGKQKQIYDPYTQDINNEQFKKLIKQDSNDMRDLIQMYGEEKAMQLLNQISANSKPKSMNYAKTGGRMGSYKRGGISDIISYLYDNDSKTQAFDNSQKGAVTEVTAPDDSEQNAQLEYQQAIEAAQSYGNYDLEQSAYRQRPFLSQAQIKEEAPLSVEDLNFKSNGKYGTSNVGRYGAQIGNEVSESLGYVPTFNSIFRDQTQQKQLIDQGVGAQNSYHLTGDAIDMKHDDWLNIPELKKKELLSKYNHVFHNNHDHLEPKKQNTRIGKNIKRAK